MTRVDPPPPLSFVDGGAGLAQLEMALSLARVSSSDVTVVVTLPTRFQARHHLPARLLDGAPSIDEVALTLYKTGYELRTIRRISSRKVGLFCVRSTAAPPLERRQVLSVIVPAYNEVETFDLVMNKMLTCPLSDVDVEIIVVESNSTDGTRERARAYEEDARVKVVLEDQPFGKGHAVRTGLEHASGDFVLIQDADLEYSVDDYPDVIRPLVNFQRSFVLGRRTRTVGAVGGIRRFAHEQHLSMLMNIGNRLFLTLFNLVYRQRLHDPFTMYKAFRRDCINGLTFESNRFDFDWELVAKLIRRGFEPLEVPVRYHSRSFSEGKKISLVRDPITWIRACFKYRFVRIG